MAYAIKTTVTDPTAATFAFATQKTMYGGKRVAEGDEVFVFASENEGGSGLVARAVVMSAKAAPRRPDLARQTPRVSVELRRSASAIRPLGRAQLKPFTHWQDGRPETELNFKLYRQATDKIIGLSDAAVAALGRFF